MQKIITFLLLCHVTSAEKYFAEFNHFLYVGVPNVPEYGVSLVIEGVLVAYYDSKVIAKVTHDWMKKMVMENKQQWEGFVQDCLAYEQVFKAETDSFNNLSIPIAVSDIPVIQEIVGCELDNETKEIGGYLTYGNNGEDFIAFDVNTGKWVTSDAKAEAIKQEWDKNEADNAIVQNDILTFCPFWLNLVLSYGKSYLMRKDLPSVSLLQKSPSSPVSCHATGFYPEKALMFWRKNGEEIHEGVDHGDILPNHDGSFQMNVDLEVSSIAPEEWIRYDCFFQLSGVQNVIVTKLRKGAIRSNSNIEESLSVVSIATIATVAVVIIIILTAFGLTTVKKRNERLALERSSTPSSDTISL